MMVSVSILWRSCAALFACLLFYSDVLGQGEKIQSAYYDNLRPAAPEPGALGSFGNTSINYYTGLPEISLELFTLQGRDFSLPIALSFDDSGVRTDDMAGPVGMKWSLQAGGYVSRTLHGLPDEHPDKGYWKHARQTNYYTNVSPVEWAGKSEKEEEDCEPDMFSISINGRMIQFVYNKNGLAQTIPRQNIRIATLLTPGSGDVRINAFEVTLEDGVKYIFGGTTETVEERKIERFTLRTGFRFLQYSDCPYTKTTDDPWLPEPPSTKTPDFTFYCAGGSNTRFDLETTNTEKAIPFFNHRWNLRSIVLPTGETMTFTYVKGANTVYALRPSAVRIQNVLTSVPFAEKIERKCDDELFGICFSYRDEVTHLYYSSAARKFLKSDPGSNPYSFQSPPEEAFNPFQYPGNPGSANFYHTLVTESTVRLTEIRAVNGNRVTFSASPRSDLPNAMRYDVINLYNFNNELVQSRRLGYLESAANETNDYAWFSEALMMNHITALKESGPDFFANYFTKHVATDILDPKLAKYVFEGVKPYNYKRMFLSSVEDLTRPGLVSKLYEFEYWDLATLKRRTTPSHDILGFPRIGSSGVAKVLISSSRRVWTSNSYKPAAGLITAFDFYEPESIADGSRLAGRMKRISYPTDGYTSFEYGGRETRLTRIQDFDHDDTLLRQREFEYSEFSWLAPRYFESFTDFYNEEQNSWMKYEIRSSAPQNDSYRPTYYADAGCPSTTAYDGTKESNNGWEVFRFTSSMDTAYRNKSTKILSIPSESNADGSPLVDIFPFPKDHSKAHLRGLLLSHQVFNKSGKLIRETAHEYEVNPYGYKPPLVRGFKGGSFAWKNTTSTSFWYGRETKAETRHRYAVYNITADWIIRKRTREIIFDGVTNDAMERIADFTYDPQYLQLTKTRSYFTSNPSSAVVSVTRYPTDQQYSGRRDCSTEYTTCSNNCNYINPFPSCYAQCDKQRTACENFVGYPEREAIEAMRATNNINVPIESQTWSEENNVSTLLSAVVYRYRRVGSNKAVKPFAVWETREAVPVTSYQSSFCSSTGLFNVDTRMREVHAYTNYDAATTKLLSQTSLDGGVEAYTWDASGSHVTKVRLNPGVSEHTSSYAFKPLVGVLNSTDPNGVVASYQYDANGRLAATYSEGDLHTRYVYHKRSDTFKETLTASITWTGPAIVGAKIRFDTPAELRPGLMDYSWMTAGKVLSTKPYVEHTFTTSGVHRVSLKKSHPDFGSASASIDLTIYAARKTVICIDGPQRIDAPDNAIPPLYGDCTTSVSTTRLRATYEGMCGSEAVLKYKWETQNASGVWVTFSIAGAVVDAPTGFINRQLGEYRVRCTVTDSCGYQATSEVKSLMII